MKIEEKKEVKKDEKKLNEVKKEEKKELIKVESGKKED